MARKLRVEYPGAIYPVMNRGDHREPIFRNDLDHKKFLATLAEACTKTDWQTGWDRSRVGGPGEGRRAKDSDRATLAGGDSGDAQMDCNGVTHGNMDACGEPALG